MAARTMDSQATKAVEWLVDQMAAASKSAWWADKLEKVGTISSAGPAYRAVQALTPAAADDGRAERALDMAARAESAARELSQQVSRLENELRLLRESQEQLARHLEDAVGPHEEGAHKEHWWSRKK